MNVVILVCLLLLAFVIPAAADNTITSQRWLPWGSFDPAVKPVNHPVTWIALCVILAVVAALLWWTVRFSSTRTWSSTWWRAKYDWDPMSLPLKTKMVIYFGIAILTLAAYVITQRLGLL
jgi:hypothetical protein